MIVVLLVCLLLEWIKFGLLSLTRARERRSFILFMILRMLEDNVCKNYLEGRYGAVPDIIK